MFKVDQIWTVQSHSVDHLVDKIWYNILITKIIDDPKEIKAHYNDIGYEDYELPECLIQNKAYNLHTHKICRSNKHKWTDTNIPEDITNTFNLNVLETFKRMKRINRDKK